jgi:hypothetical protein
VLFAVLFAVLHRSHLCQRNGFYISDAGITRENAPPGSLLGVTLIVIFVVNIPCSGLRPPRKKTVIFVGTSYTRAIFFEAIKLVRQ